MPFYVADAAGAVAGYVIARYGAAEAEILNLGVAMHARRRGIGRCLVQHMLAELGERDVSVVYLEVRESNAAARRLYEEVGFREVGRRARYYRQPVEDAVILRAAIPAGKGVA